jgi:hypothetical protein
MTKDIPLPVALAIVVVFVVLIGAAFLRGRSGPPAATGPRTPYELYRSYSPPGPSDR